jgi:hypothetical protein
VIDVSTILSPNKPVLIKLVKRLPGQIASYQIASHDQIKHYTMTPKTMSSFPGFCGACQADPDTSKGHRNSFRPQERDQKYSAMDRWIGHEFVSSSQLLESVFSDLLERKADLSHT